MKGTGLPQNVIIVAINLMLSMERETHVNFEASIFEIQLSRESISAATVLTSSAGMVCARRFKVKLKPGSECSLR